MGKEIPEIRLGMCEAQEGDKENLEALVLGTMPKGLEEFVSLTMWGASINFSQRVLREVDKNPARFARGFSLDPIVAAGVLGRTSYFVVVGLSVMKSDEVYHSLCFRLELQKRYPGDPNLVLKTLDSTAFSSVGDLKEHFDAFTKAVIESTLQSRNPGLVFARLLTGISKAYGEILPWELHEVARGRMRKEDVPRLFNEYMHCASKEKGLEETRESLREEIGAAKRRVKFLENVIQEAANAIDASRDMLHSKTLEGIRERLEGVLNEGKPQEGESVRGLKSIS